MPDEEQTQSNGANPDGVYRGTTADRNSYPVMDPKDVRNESGAIHSRLRVGGGYDFGAAFREAVSPGSKFIDIFTRTDIASEDEAKAIAVSFARRIKAHKRNPHFEGEFWLFLPPMTLAYWAYMALMMSYDRQSKKEGTMSQIGMLAPDLWPKQAESLKGKGRAARKR